MSPSNSKPLKERLQEKVWAYGQTIWKDKWEPDNEELWLNNFQNPDPHRRELEIINMLYLLSKFMFFGSRQVKELLISLYRDLYKYPIIEGIRRANNDTLDEVLINQKFKEALQLTRFVGVGGPSESGPHLLYNFRQENQLHPNLLINGTDIFSSWNLIRIFLDKLSSYIPRLRTIFKRSYKKSKIANPDIRRYVFIDDICGSGSQAVSYLKPLVDGIKSKDPQIEVNYFMLFGTEHGLKAVRSLNIFDSVEAVFSIDESFQVFSQNSRYYKFVPDKKKIKRLFSKQIAAENGDKLVAGTILHGHPLGWRNGQLLLGLFHNTPDNTLPIIWSESKNWKPAFKRYEKLY